MQSNIKRNTIVTTRAMTDGMIGFTVLGYPEMVFDPTKAHVDNRSYAEFHGWVQRITDTAAIGTTDKDDNIIPRAERMRLKAEAMARVIAHYESGVAEWAMRAAPSFRTATDHSLTITALMSVKGMTFQAVNEYVNASAKTHNVSRTVVLDALSVHSTIKPTIDALRSAKVAALGINSDDLLEEMTA